jgi:hypothetical protein
MAVLCLIGCGDGQTTGICPPSGAGCGGRQVDQLFNEPGAPIIDVLLVLDDSPSMAGRGELLTTLGQELARTASALPPADLQTLVVTTSADHGSGECARPPAPPPRCAADQALRLTTVCGQRSNLSSGVPEAFGCAVAVGSAGCAVEQPLAAIQAALVPPFLRPDSQLFVLVLTDEDDCSAPSGPLPFAVQPGEAERDAPELGARCREADQRGQLVDVASAAALLAGRPAALSVLAPLPAPRLERLAQAARGEVRELAVGNVAGALSSLGQRLAVGIGAPCAEPGLIDRDPDRPGLQPECTVTEQTPDEAGQLVSHPLPACDQGGAPPCWRVTTDLTCPSGIKWSIDHGGCSPPRGSMVKTSCAAASP